MDDPWGSPWTSAGRAGRTPSPTKSDLEPPPRAFLSVSSSPKLPAVSADSPWADDKDGFGDGFAADSATTSAQSPWGGRWGGADAGVAHDQQQLTPTPGDGGFGFGQASPITWPGNIASPNANNTNAFRQPSPDPWASEFDDFRGATDVQSTPRSVLNRPSTPTLEKELGSGQSEEELGPVWDHGHGGTGVDAATEGAAADHEAEGDLTDGTTTIHDARDSLGSDDGDQPRLRTSPKPRSSRSRSSSVSRNDSDSERERQDSPITSVDEDAKARIAIPPRKVSGKIQVLVEKYDGLAQAAVDEPVPVVRDSGLIPPKRSTPGTETPSEAATDFGDFEDADETPPTPSAQFSEPSSPRHSTRDSVERTPTPRRGSPERAPSVTVTASTDVRSTVTKRAPVKFDVDLERIDSLFDDLQPGPPSSHENPVSFLPDHIITDSFTQISERKAWYRISRHGSSRMHNSGDNDNYRRVAWPTTTVHDETLKIVRRWMEQDSITGRTTLGGGSNRTNMFNWDSAAEPVALEDIFAKRRRPPRPMSLQQPVKKAALIPPAPTSASSTNSAVTAPTQRPLSLAGPPAAAFGCSTSPIEQLPVEIQPTRPRGSDLKQELSLAPALANAPSQRPALLNPPAPQEDDDDDWGEMVSSPPVDAKPMSLPVFGGPETTSGLSLVPSTDLLPGSSARPHTANVGHSSIEDLWELPQPEKPRKELPIDTPATAEPLSYFGQPVKPTVAPATSVTSPNFTPTTPLATMPPLPIPAETPIEQTSQLQPATDEQANVDFAAHRILDNLPDLSYMLR